MGAPGRGLRHDPLWRAVRALDLDPRRFALAVLCGAGALCSAVGLMATSAWLISRAAEQPPVLYLQVAVVATRAFGVGRGVLRYVERLVSHDVALRGVTSLRAAVYARLAEADPRRVAQLRRGDLLARVGADLDTLSDVMVRSVLPMAVSAVTSLAAAGLMAAVLPPAGLALLTALALAGIVAPWLAARAAEASERDGAEVRTELSAQTLAVLEGTSELVVAGAVPDRIAEVERLDAQLARTLDRSARPAALGAWLGTAATGAAMLAGLVLGMDAVAAGDVPFVQLAVLVLTPIAAAEAVTALPAAAIGLTRARSAAARVMALMDLPAAPEVATGTAAVPAGAALEARGLSTGWGADRVVTRGLDLTVAPGTATVVVGANGSGKTTLLLTLAGLVPAVAGQVRLGGEPLSGLDPAALRTAVSFTAEDAHVFTTTVRENVRVARGDAADDDVTAALGRAGLGDWLARLPHGLDTVVGTGDEHGAGLSGGERRRLVLARALVGGAQVLLLDEPTEHLDETTAAEVMHDVLTCGRTVVVVTHRTEGLDAADAVVRLDGR